MSVPRLSPDISRMLTESIQLWQLFLTQGLLYGIGSSMYYFPIMSLTPAYFDRNRGMAMGIVLAGSGVGGLVLSPVFHALLTSLGIRWALRILGIWNLVLSIPISSVLTKKHGAAAGATGRTRVSMALVKRGTFVLQVCCAFKPRLQREFLGAVCTLKNRR